MATFDLGALSAYTKENAGELLDKSFLSLDTVAVANMLEGQKYKAKFPMWTDDDYDVLQAGNTCTPTSKGEFATGQYDVEVVPVRLFKDFCTKELRTYFTNQYLPLGAMNEKENLPQGLGIVQHALKKWTESIEVALHHGEAGGASTISSLNLFDGYITRINDLITATTIPSAQVTSAIITQTNAVSTYNTAVDTLPAKVYAQAIAGANWICICDPAVAMAYSRNIMLTYGANSEYARLNQSVIMGTNIRFVPVAGLIGTGRSFILNKDTFWIATDLTSDWANIEVTQGTGSEKDLIFVDCEIKIGTFIQNPEYVLPVGRW
jgi:hypothetical protein